MATTCILAEQDGHITGAYGVMPGPMRLRGRPIRVAVASQFLGKGALSASPYFPFNHV